jgi:hypothetical protein
MKGCYCQGCLPHSTWAQDCNASRLLEKGIDKSLILGMLAVRRMNQSWIEQEIIISLAGQKSRTLPCIQRPSANLEFYIKYDPKT